MKLFVGLGNPGARHARNRHNVGWMAIDAIAAAHGFGPWRAKFQGQVSEGRLAGDKALLLKPATFMNLSGQSVGEAMRFLKLTTADLIVLHDELDLAPGRLRVKDGGGHAGHNGLRSIHQHVGPDYRRVRIGIGHPGDKNRVADYVLHDFAKADAAWLDPLLDGVADGAEKLAAGDAAGFQNAVALRVAPNRPTKPTPEAKQKTAAQSAARPSDAEKSASPLERLLARFSRDPGAGS
ncbi:MAG: aminoacyl-tRNA hydrolase [Rhodobacteraceae bacterium]|nr:MAG: aminoacyl-tRNA hydrolase [Paracoccaceae bacterium]